MTELNTSKNNNKTKTTFFFLSLHLLCIICFCCIVATNSGAPHASIELCSHLINLETNQNPASFENRIRRKYKSKWYRKLPLTLFGRFDNLQFVSGIFSILLWTIIIFDILPWNNIISDKFTWNNQKCFSQALRNANEVGHILNSFNDLILSTSIYYINKSTKLPHQFFVQKTSASFPSYIRNIRCKKIKCDFGFLGTLLFVHLFSSFVSFIEVLVVCTWYIPVKHCILLNICSCVLRLFYSLRIQYFTLIQHPRDN